MIVGNITRNDTKVLKDTICLSAYFESFCWKQSYKPAKRTLSLAYNWNKIYCNGSVPWVFPTSLTFEAEVKENCCADIKMRPPLRGQARGT